MVDAWAARFTNSTHSPGTLGALCQNKQSIKYLLPRKSWVIVAYFLVLLTVLFCIFLHIVLYSFELKQYCFLTRYFKQYCMFSISLFYIVYHIVFHSNNIVYYIFIYCKLLFVSKQYCICIVSNCLLYCFMSNNIVTTWKKNLEYCQFFFWGQTILLSIF